MQDIAFVVGFGARQSIPQANALSGCSSIRLSAVRNMPSALPPSRQEKNVAQSSKKGSILVVKEVIVVKGVKVICPVVFYLE